RHHGHRPPPETLHHLHLSPSAVIPAPPVSTERWAVLGSYKIRAEPRLQIAVFPRRIRIRNATRPLLIRPIRKRGAAWPRLQIRNLVRCKTAAVIHVTQTLIAGWDEVECLKVFTFVSERVGLQSKIISAFIGQPGTAPELEIELRLFYRHMLLDHCKYISERIFWLIQILKPWPIVNKARLLYIIYGPVCTHTSMEMVLYFFYQTVLIFVHSKPTSLMDDLFRICNEMGLSNGWLAENLARFIILCGDDICFNIMASKAINHHIAQLSTLVVFLTLVCEKDGYCMQWMTRIIERLCAVMNCVQDKMLFLNSIEKVFMQIILHFIPSLIGNLYDTCRLGCFLECNEFCLFAIPNFFECL
uniref:FBXO47 ARM repeats region domain-containing protein n=1 Tax=Eptatretus burgeri TaxID=7764 RepID=A0A8C4N7Y6_EPTBU